MLEMETPLLTDVLEETPVELEKEPEEFAMQLLLLVSHLEQEFR
jgi:hypothetical protein